MRTRQQTTFRAIAAAALVVATLVAGMLGISLASDLGTIASWWPAGGVGVVAALAAPRRWWPRIFAGLFVAYALANVLMGRGVLISLAFGGGDVLETIVVSHVVVRTIGRRLRRVHDTWWLLLATVEGSVLAGLVVAGVGAGFLDEAFWPTLALTTIAHAASIVLIVPALMAPPAVHRIPALHLVGQGTCAAVAMWFAFGYPERVNVGFALYPLITWAAVTLGVRIVAAELLLLAAGISALAVGGSSTLAQRADLVPLGLGSQLVQLFLITLAVTGLPLALAMRQRVEAVEVVAARERSFQENFLSTAVPTALLTFDGQRLVFDEVNQPALALLGRGAAQLRGVDVDDVLEGPLSMVVEAHDLADGHEPSWTGSRDLVGDPGRHLALSVALIGKAEGVHRLSMTLHDATEEREMQRRLAAQQELNRAITDSSPSPMIVLDAVGTVLVANPAVGEVTGYDETELVGSTLWEALMPDDSRETVAQFFAEGNEPPERGESMIVAADGSRRQVLFNIRRLDQPIAGEGRWIVSASDVTEERRVALLMSHLLASATTVAFIGTDVEGRVTLFNQGAAQMLGVSPDAAAGRSLVDFLRPEDVAHRARVSGRLTGFAAVVGAVAHGGEPETHDWAWRSASGAVLQVSMTVSRLADDLGTTRGFFFVARDVSDTRRSQEILVRALDRERQAVAKLQALDSVRDEFISTVSHELRTPMTSIIGSAEMLTDGLVGSLGDGQRSLVEVISRNGERLLALADDLLALAQNDVPGWAETLVRLDLRDILLESHESVASLLHGRDLAVDVRLGDRPVPVHGDVQKLERAVTNLLSNAIKFTPDGGAVTARVWLDPRACVAHLEVADTGLGIPEGEIDRVFERFFRSSTVQALAIQGTGLGLPIVKDIVESHHGTIDVASSGAGTRFSVALPLADAVEPARPRAAG